MWWHNFSKAGIRIDIMLTEPDEYRAADAHKSNTAIFIVIRMIVCSAFFRSTECNEIMPA